MPFTATACTQASTLGSKPPYERRYAPLSPFLKTYRSSSRKGYLNSAPRGSCHKNPRHCSFACPMGKPARLCHYLLVGLSALSGPHMRLRDVMLFQQKFLRESMPLIHPWHEPPFQAPSASDAMDTPRDQRTPGEVATYLKSRFCPKPYQGKRRRSYDGLPSDLPPSQKRTLS